MYFTPLELEGLRDQSEFEYIKKNAHRVLHGMLWIILCSSSNVVSSSNINHVGGLASMVGVDPPGGWRLVHIMLEGHASVNRNHDSWMAVHQKCIHTWNLEIVFPTLAFSKRNYIWLFDTWVWAAPTVSHKWMSSIIPFKELTQGI